VFMLSACFEPPCTVSNLGPVVLVCAVFFSADRCMGSEVCHSVGFWGLEERAGDYPGQGGDCRALSRRGPSRNPACRWRVRNQKPASCSPPPAEPGWEQRRLHWAPPTCLRTLAEVQRRPTLWRWPGETSPWLGGPSHLCVSTCWQSLAFFFSSHSPHLPCLRPPPIPC